jgi:hypothetical protein
VAAVKVRLEGRHRKPIINDHCVIWPLSDPTEKRGLSRKTRGWARQLYLSCHSQNKSSSKAGHYGPR